MRAATQKDYNKSYYQTHPELREKARERERRKRSQAQAFRTVQRKSEQGTVRKSSKVLTQIELIVLPFLLICLTYLLLHEMVSFYSIADGSLPMSWIKAIALEASVLVFSFLGPCSALRGILYKAVAISICAFSTYAMCANHYSTGISMVRADQVTERTIKDLESTIADKRIQRDEYRTKGWMGAARKMDRSIDVLREKLDGYRAQLIGIKPAVATTSTTLALIMFRVLLMIANILAADRLRLTLKNLETFSSDLEISREPLKRPKAKIEISKSENSIQSRRVADRIGEWIRQWIAVGERMKV